jgi:hypothetical protein
MKEDYLYEDPPIANQKFCLVSMIRKDTLFNPRVVGLKVRGVFNSKITADQQAAELVALEPHMDVFVMQVGMWTHIDKMATNIEEQQKGEDILNQLMKKAGATLNADYKFVDGIGNININAIHEDDDIFDNDDEGNIFVADDKLIDKDKAIDIDI